ncbi:MAG: hypothetical protein OXI11_05125 [Gammaproteobacteria bacterium]|nr:hypothetical protein [Gammaproteobacteria bacterium]
MNGSKNEPSYRECLVSYLAVPDLPLCIEDIADEGTRRTFGLARRFTRHYSGEAPGGVGEPECFDDGSSGAGTAYIVRARPIGPRAGAVALVLELLDLLNIQLECLAGERVVRGAAVIDFLHVGPNRDGAHAGPALSRAREMEANDAILPRITVAEEIVSRLRLDESLWTADHFLRAEVDLIDCMLRAEGSGVHYIDYLRAGLGEFDYDFDRYAAFLGHHQQIVESSLADNSPWRTRGTWEWLKYYHNARIDDDLTRPDAMARADECDRGMAGALTPLRIG